MPDRTQSKEAAKIKAARPELNGQEFRPCIYQGITLEDYEVAPDGLVISYKFKTERLLSWGGVGPIGSKYPAVGLRIPTENLHHLDTNVRGYSASLSTVGRNVKVHTLVADAWLGMDSCPEDLEPWWPTLPLEFKEAMRPYFQLDHIDDNKLNPHVLNLRFVPPKDNHYNIKAGIQNQKTKLDTELKI